MNKEKISKLLEELLEELKGLTSEEDTNKTFLELSCCDIENADEVKNYPNLKTLWLNNNPKLEDIFALSLLTNLQVLHLYNNIKLEDIKALSGLINLQILSLDSNPKLEDISTLSGLINLQTLDLYNIPNLADISALSGLTNLQTLVLFDNPKLVDISALEHLDNLTFVNLKYTGINKEDLDTKRILEKLEKQCIEGFYI